MQTRLARPRSGGLGRSCLAGAGYAAILNDRAGHLAQAALHLRRSGCRRAVVSCRFVAAANPVDTFLPVYIHIQKTACQHTAEHQETLRMA